MDRDRLVGAFADLCRERVGRAGVVTFMTEGNSMLPLIPAGSVLHVQPVGPGEVRKGDILTFWLQGRLVAHRVLGIASNKSQPAFQTKGDASFRADPLIQESLVVGRVTGVERHGRLLVMSAPGWRILGGLAASCWPLTFWIALPGRAIRRLRRMKPVAR